MRTLAERLDALTEPEPMTGCFLWTGANNGVGYGKISVGGFPRYAHRVAWELAHGEVPEGLMVLHRCDVRWCVNVGHLFLGTHLDNMHDMHAKNRRPYSRRTECKRGHPFVPSNIYEWHGERNCVECRKARKRKQNAALKAQRRAGRSA